MPFVRCFHALEVKSFLFRTKKLFFCDFAVALLLFGKAFAQGPQTAASNAQPSGAEASSTQASSGTEETPTFRTSTRLVTIEVVVRDDHGQPVQGLSANDFQVIEQVGSKHDQHLQKIAAFRAVAIKQIIAQDKEKVQLPAGVYSNLVTMDKHPAPPTILLVDGLNTDRASQAQLHQQMIHMLSSIPADVPVAVFLLGHDLRMIQDFTADPELLKSALQKARSTQSSDSTDVDPVDNPDSLSAQLEEAQQTSPLPPQVQATERKGPQSTSESTLTQIKIFEREAYAAQMDQRVVETLDALRALARHVAGYPGRKNLIWISSSFPIMIDPTTDPSAEQNVGLRLAGFRNYKDQMEEVATAMDEAKIAIYPIDPAGLQAQALFQASTRTRGSMAGQRPGAQLAREDQYSNNRQQAMERLADETGGIVCLNNNDLGDCIRKAVNDGNSFYEIAYYPDAGNWTGEFHKIIVKTNTSGTHLAYRHGYYAQSSLANDEKASTHELQEGACGDLLTSTSLFIGAKQYPVDKGRAKYFVALDPATLSFSLEKDGGRTLALKLGACTFDKSGKPLQFWQDAVHTTFTDKQYSALMAQHGFLHSFVLTPAPGVATVRLIVEDEVTGRMGSVDIPYSQQPMVQTSQDTGRAPAAKPQ